MTNALHQCNGGLPGDSARAAVAMIQVVNADRPPLRLLLDSMASSTSVRSWLQVRLQRSDGQTSLSARTSAG